MQVIPHVTDEIKAAVRKLATDDVDVVITEIGGTVGDIEGLPFLEAIRQFALDVGKNELPLHPPDADPVSEGGRRGEDQADAALASNSCGRSASSPTSSSAAPNASWPRTMADKIALFCNVERRAVIEERDKEFSIYEVPVSLVENKLDELIVEKLSLQGQAAGHRATGAACCSAIMQPGARGHRSRVVGKYIKHHDAYKSVYESLDHAGIAVSTPRRRPQDRGGGDRARRGRARAERRRRHPGARRLRLSRHRAARSRRSALPANARCRSSASVWACSVR